VVLSKEKIQHIFSHLSGVNLLIAHLLYGSGLRLQECLQLRIKDVEMTTNTIVVYSGKGDKDRQTVLPASIKEKLEEQIRNVHILFEKGSTEQFTGSNGALYSGTQLFHCR